MTDQRPQAQKLGKVLRYVGGTLVLGALGSGLWSRGFEPLLSFLVRVAASISHTYKDGIYARAANGFNEGTALELLTMALYCVGGLVGFLAGSFRNTMSVVKAVEAVQRGEKSHVEAPPPETKTIRRGVKITAVVSATFVLMVISTFARATWANSITTFSLKAIEILGPVIDERERLTLRAQFFQVQTADEYATFYNRVQDLAAQHHVQLPHFRPL